MLISTVEELRAFFPAHTLRNLDTMRGFLNNSENTFLRQRIGQPLLTELNRQYPSLIEQVIAAHSFEPTVDYPLPPFDGGDSTITDPDPDASVPEALAEDDPTDITPWITLIILCQRCIVYDAFMRAADISPISANDMGLNIAESDNFAAASDKRIDRYKSSLSHEAHDAVDRLLIQLEEWQREYTAPVDSGASTDSPVDGGSSTALVPDESSSGSSASDAEATPVPDAPSGSSSDTPVDGGASTSPIPLILSLWQKSPTYYLTDGLLFNTATEFNTFVDIYDSRDRFIQLLPDIRYCQELHIEAEIGIDLLLDLKQKHRTGALNPIEQKAYTMLQRSLSLYVEARSKMFSRPDARDEACGYMNLTTAFIRKHQRDFDETAIQTSPLYDPHRWPLPASVPDGSPSGSIDAAHHPHHPEGPAPDHPHHDLSRPYNKAVILPPPSHHHPYDHHDDDHGMLITSLI